MKIDQGLSMHHHLQRQVAQVALAVVTANGQVSPEERRALDALDRLGCGPVSTLCDARLAAGGDQPDGWRQACAALAPLDLGRRVAIVRALAEIAASDDHICGREIETMGTVTRLLGLPAQHAVSSLNAAITARAAQRPSAAVP